MAAAALRHLAFAIDRTPPGRRRGNRKGQHLRLLRTAAYAAAYAASSSAHLAAIRSAPERYCRHSQASDSCDFGRPLSSGSPDHLWRSAQAYTKSRGNPLDRDLAQRLLLCENSPDRGQVPKQTGGILFESDLVLRTSPSWDTL